MNDQRRAEVRERFQQAAEAEIARLEVADQVAAARAEQRERELEQWAERDRQRLERAQALAEIQQQIETRYHQMVSDPNYRHGGLGRRAQLEAEFVRWRDELTGEAERRRQFDAEYRARHGIDRATAQETGWAPPEALGSGGSWQARHLQDLLTSLPAEAPGSTRASTSLKAGDLGERLERLAERAAHQLVNLQPAVVVKSVAAQPVSVDPAGIVSAIVNTTGVVDKQGDRMEAGSWSKAVSDFQAGATRPKVLFNHDWNQPVGRVVGLEEIRPNDPRLPASHTRSGGGALVARLAFNTDTQAGREALSHVRFGSVDEFSVGFTPVESSVSYERGSASVRKIGMVDQLLEISLVMVGASLDTQPLGVGS